MSDFWKKFLIHTGIGLGAALLISILLGLFRAETAVDRLRILCDGFFVAAMGLLCAGSIRWTSNGGVMDGLGYATKIGLSRMRRDFETARQGFGEYQKIQRAKARTPKYLLLAGLVQLVIAVALYAAYANLR